MKQLDCLLPLVVSLFKSVINLYKVTSFVVQKTFLEVYSKTLLQRCPK